MRRRLEAARGPVAGGAMKIEALREFVVFARHMNFSTAARELYMSQPSLSTHIRDLERETGLELVERSRPLHLTEVGMRFLECAQQTVDIFERGVERCRSIQQNPPVRLSVLAGMAPVAKALRSVRGVPFNVRTQFDGIGSLSELARGEVDVLGMYDVRVSPELVEMVERCGLDFFPLYSERMAVNVARTSPLAHLERLTRSDLDGATFSIYDAHYFELWSMLIKGIVGPGVRISFKLVPLDDQANLAYQPMDSTEVHLCGSDYLQAISGNRDDLVFFDQLDGEDIRLDYLIVYRRDEDSEPVKRVLDCFRRIADEAALSECAQA